MRLPNTFDDKTSKLENPYSVTELAGNSSSGRGPALKDRRAIVLLTVIMVGVVAVLLQFGQQSVYDGSFDLTLKVFADPTIDESSVSFADCWSPVDAAYAMQTGTQGEQSFNPGKTIGVHERLIRVPFSGRTPILGFGGSYVESRFIIVEFATTVSAKRVIQRKQFAIPKGRGARSMTIVLP